MHRIFRQLPALCAFPTIYVTARRQRTVRRRKHATTPKKLHRLMKCRATHGDSDRRVPFPLQNKRVWSALSREIYNFADDAAASISARAGLRTLDFLGGKNVLRRRNNEESRFGSSFIRHTRSLTLPFTPLRAASNEGAASKKPSSALMSQDDFCRTSNLLRGRISCQVVTSHGYHAVLLVSFRTSRRFPHTFSVVCSRKNRNHPFKSCQNCVFSHFNAQRVGGPHEIGSKRGQWRQRRRLFFLPPSLPSLHPSLPPSPARPRPPRGELLPLGVRSCVSVASGVDGPVAGARVGERGKREGDLLLRC